MKPGPTPKPNVLKLIEGKKGKRPIDLAGGINPEVALPDMPRHLRKEARKEWKRITPELLELRLLSKIDRSALTLYCEAWGTLVELEMSLNAEIEGKVARGMDYYQAVESALTDVTPNNFVQMSAAEIIRGKKRAEVLRYLDQFGMSPASRGRVTPLMPTQQTLPGIEPKPGFGSFRT